MRKHSLVPFPNGYLKGDMPDDELEVDEEEGEDEKGCVCLPSTSIVWVQRSCFRIWELGQPSIQRPVKSTRLISLKVHVRRSSEARAIEGSPQTTTPFQGFVRGQQVACLA